MLQEFATEQSASDPVHISPEASLLIPNLLAQYSRLGKEDSLKDDAMGALIQGLRLVYEKEGHCGSWTVIGDVAYGNALEKNPDIPKLRKAHRVDLSKLGS